MTKRALVPLAAGFEEMKTLEDFSFSRTYIKASKNPSSDLGADVLWQAAERAKASPAWAYHEIATTHMVASNRPGSPLIRAIHEPESKFLRGFLAS